MTEITEMNTFKNIKNPYLRAFNRLIYAKNLTAAGHLESSRKYLDHLNSAEELLDIARVSFDLDRHGVEWVTNKVRQLAKEESDNRPDAKVLPFKKEA